MPLEFLVPVGFCPRAQVSKLFFAVGMGGNINRKAGGDSQSLGCSRRAFDEEHRTWAGRGGTYAGQTGRAVAQPRLRGATRLRAAYAPLPRGHGFNSSVMPARCWATCRLSRTLWAFSSGMSDGWKPKS